MDKRSERYPVIGLALPPEKIKLLREKATKYRYTTRAGPQAGGLAKDLFEWAWPIFETVDFDPQRLPQESRETREMKDWFWALYQHLPRDRRRDIIRGLSDRFNFAPPPKGHVDDSIAEGQGPESKRPSRTGARRGAL